MVLANKSTNQHSSAALCSISTAVGILAATTMFLSGNFGFSSVIASTTVQNDNENSNNGTPFNTSGIEAATSGDYAFQSTDSGVVLVNGNSLNASFVTNVKRVQGNIVYSNSSQFISIYNTGEDLSGATYTITNTSDDAVVYSGRFTQVSVSGQSYYALCLPSSIIKAGFDAEQANQGKLHMNVINGSTRTSYLTTLDIKAMSGTASVQLPSVTATEDGKNASAHFGNQTVNIVDANDQKIGSTSLTGDDISVAHDSSQTNQYTYTLNTSGSSKVNSALNVINQKALTVGGIYYTLDKSTPGTVTINAPAPIKTTLMVKYVDESGNTIKTDTVNGNVDDHGTYTAQIPSGYELADGQDENTTYTLNDSDNLLTLKLRKIAPAQSSLRINYVDENGTSIRTDVVTGAVGKHGTYSATVPNGYSLADGQRQATDYTLGSTDSQLNIKLTTVSVKQPMSMKVNYVDENGDIVKIDTISGSAGDSGTYQVDVPSGYRLQNSKQTSLSYTLADNADPITITVAKNTPKTRSTRKTPFKPRVEPPAATPQPTVDSSKPEQLLPNNHTVVQPERSATATVMYIDGITRKVLATEILTGHDGQRIVFDTYSQVYPFQLHGYYVVHDDTMRVSAAYFNSVPGIYRVVLERAANGNQRSSALAPSTAPQANTNSGQHRSKKTAANKKRPNVRHHRKQKRAKHLSKRDHQEPVIFDQEIDAILSSSGKGGGSERSDISELGKFFISLSGTINFGIKNN